MDSIYTIIDEIVNSNIQSILATIIKVEGSAYRKEGTTMLFLEDDRHIGVISAGCLEEDLTIRAQELFNKDTPQSYTIIYDMSSEDDLSWGRGAGCNGKVHILLEKVTTDMKNHIKTLCNHLKHGQQVTSIRVLQNDTVTKTSYLTNSNQVFGDQIDPSILPIAISKNKAGIEYIKEPDTYAYFQYYRPKLRLFIFGAGPDVRPLAAIAVKVGFEVTVWDWRPNYYQQAHFPHVTVLQNETITNVIDHAHFSGSDSVIIMTHDFQKDKEILHLLLKESQMRYLGILGPRKRTSRLLNGNDIPKNLHSPVGLSIGAEGPDEIAISIIADLIKTHRND